MQQSCSLARRWCTHPKHAYTAQALLTWVSGLGCQSSHEWGRPAWREGALKDCRGIARLSHGPVCLDGKGLHRRLLELLPMPHTRGEGHSAKVLVLLQYMCFLAHLCTASSSRSSLPSMRAAASSSLIKRPSQRCQSGPALPAPVAALCTTVHHIAALAEGRHGASSGLAGMASQRTISSMQPR